MKVSSPVGTFPFEPERVRVADGRLTVEGRMGAWPATVEMEPSDAVAVLRLAGPRALVALAALAVGVRLGSRRRRGR